MGKLKIGLVALDFLDMQVDKIFAYMKSYEIKYIEFYNRVNIFSEQADQVKDLLRINDIKVSAVSSLAKLNQDDDVKTCQELIIETIKLARKLDTSYSCIMYGRNPDCNDSKAIAIFKERIKPCLEVAEENNVTILLENLFSRRGRDLSAMADTTLALIEGVNSPYFKLNFDTGNFQIGGEEAFPYAYETLKPHIRYFHLKDVTKYATHFHGDIDFERPLVDCFRGQYVTTPLGRGSVNHIGLIKELLNDNFNGVLAIEPFNNIAYRERFINESLNFLSMLK